MINAHSVNVLAKNSLAPASANATLLPDEIGVYCMCHGHLEQIGPEIVGWRSGGVLK
jgi:hypothetical protein